MLDTMTLTKLTGAFCGSLLVLLLGKFGAELIYHADSHGHGDDHVQGYVIDTGSEETAEVEEEGPTFEELFAQADNGKGEKVFNKCKACHQLDQGANGAGTYLYGLDVRDVGTADGFGYSGNLVAVADVWTPEALDQFLASPSGYAPGTTMAFSGLKKGTDRANLIAFLNQTDGG